MTATDHRGLAFASIRAGAAIAVLAGAAKVLKEPLVFPSLGPTAFLLGSGPLQPGTAARPVIAGHAIGIGAGYFSLVIFRLTDHAPALVEGVTWPRLGAAALCVTLTTLGMLWSKAIHAPAAASSLIVALGLIRTPAKVGLMLVAVAALWAVGTGLGLLTRRAETAATLRAR